MSINRKTLALLTAAVIGSGLAACQRGGQDKSASSQDSSPMNQAPKQGYTGPASPSTSPPSSAMGNAGAPPASDTGNPGSTNPSNSQQQPEQNQQQQPDQNQQQR